MSGSHLHLIIKCLERLEKEHRRLIIGAACFFLMVVIIFLMGFLI
jgi:hypothetical protein